MSELAVKINARLYEARDSVKTLYGPGWLEELRPYMETLENIHNAKGVSYLTLGQTIAREMQDRRINPLMVLAAMVELMEPSAPAGGGK